MKMFNEFFGNIEKEDQEEMKSHIILDSMSELREAIVLTFWETKDDIDTAFTQLRTAAWQGYSRG